MTLLLTWLQEVPTGTVLQPSLERRKSVNRLRSEDFVDGHITNYCLTTQQQDSEGELETKLYKVINISENVHDSCILTTSFIVLDMILYI